MRVQYALFSLAKLWLIRYLMSRGSPLCDYSVYSVDDDVREDHQQRQDPDPEPVSQSVTERGGARIREFTQDQQRQQPDGNDFGRAHLREFPLIHHLRQDQEHEHTHDPVRECHSPDRP